MKVSPIRKAWRCNTRRPRLHSWAIQKWQHCLHCVLWEYWKEEGIRVGGGSRIPRRRGTIPPGGGANIQIYQIFSKKCMKLRKFWSVGGPRGYLPPFRCVTAESGAAYSGVFLHISVWSMRWKTAIYFPSVWVFIKQTFVAELSLHSLKRWSHLSMFQRNWPGIAQTSERYTM